MTVVITTAIAFVAIILAEHWHLTANAKNRHQTKYCQRNITLSTILTIEVRCTKYKSDSCRQEVSHEDQEAN